MCRLLLLTLVGFLLAGPQKVLGQESRTESPQRYRILSTSKVDTMQKEVDQAVAAGYRGPAQEAATIFTRQRRSTSPTTGWS